MLEGLGYRNIQIATNFDEGATLLISKRFDIILMDVNLGGGADGIDLVNSISILNKSTPVVYVTGNSDFNTISKAKYSNPLNIITKPFTETDLIIQLELAFHKSESKDQKGLEETIYNNPLLDEITARQKQVLFWIVKGESTKLIADRLNVNVRTVDGHRAKLLDLMDAKNTADLVRKAIGY